MPPPATMSPAVALDQPGAVDARRHHLAQPPRNAPIERRRVERHAHVVEHRDAVVRRARRVVERRGPEAVDGHGRGLYSADGVDPPTRAARTRAAGLSEKGGMKNGQPQRSDDRLFMQFLAFGGCADARPLAAALAAAGIAGVLYEDVNDPRGVGAADVQRGSRVLRRSRPAAAQRPGVRGR